MWQNPPHHHTWISCMSSNSSDFPVQITVRKRVTFLLLCPGYITWLVGLLTPQWDTLSSMNPVRLPSLSRDLCLVPDSSGIPSCWLVWLEEMSVHSQKYKPLSASNVPLPLHSKSHNNKNFILTLTSGSFSHSSIYKS